LPKCRACPTVILWALNRNTGKSSPLVAEPLPEGNIRLDTETRLFDVLTGEALEEAREKGEPLYLNHFANCEARERFRTARV
jgi:hypothetical protein